MADLIISNGSYLGQALLWRLTADGRFVGLWEKTPEKVIEFIGLVCGQMPQKPTLGAGGEMKEAGFTELSNHTLIPNFAYSPAGDVINHEESAMYEIQCKSWIDDRQALLAELAMLFKHP